MSIRSLLLGLLLGFAVGWVASRWHADPPPDPGSVDPVPIAGGDPARLTGAPAPAVESTGSTTPGLGVLQAGLDRAKQSRDGEALVSSVRGLANLDTPAADEALLAIVRDPGVLLPPDAAQALQDALEHATIAGVAEAAKARFALRLAAGYDPDRAGAGWFALIGAHGGKAALDWAREEGWHEHAPLWKELVPAFLASSHPTVIPYARELAQTEGEDVHRLPRELRWMELFRLATDAWARLDPERAIPAIVEEIERQFRPDGRVVLLGSHMLIRIYIRRLPDERLDEAATLIRRLPERISHLQSRTSWIHQLHARGMALAGLEDVIRIPTTMLEQMAASGGPKQDRETHRAQAARQMILRYPWMWSDRSLEAVERSIEWERWPADQELLRTQLLEVRSRRRWSGEPAR